MDQMNKEAAPNPKLMWQAIKKMNPFSAAREGESIVRNVKKPAGKFVTEDAGTSAVKSQARFFNEDELREKARKTSSMQGTGGLTTDAFLGLIKKVAPKSREPIEKAVEKGKNTLERYDTKAGAALAGSNPDSMRGKFFSTKVSRQVGEVKLPDGKVSALDRVDRRPSLVAPVTNTAKVTTPFLGAAYIGDKLYGQDNQSVTQTPYEDNERYAYNETQALEMEKIAYIKKVADLEEEVNIVRKDLHQEVMEKKATEEKYAHLMENYEELEKTASTYHQNMLESKASHEELRLRTIAKQRSKTAVDLADQLLETGLIKQAHYQGKVDELMVCDDNILNSYNLLVKQAKDTGDSLESMSAFMDIKGNDKIAFSPHDLLNAGLNKSGQTMGEAARDLMK